MIFKSCMELRPDIKSKILILSELYDYLNWINKENLNFKGEKIEMYTEAEEMIGSSPLSAKSWYAFLTKNSSKRDEEKYILCVMSCIIDGILGFTSTAAKNGFNAFRTLFLLLSGQFAWGD